MLEVRVAARHLAAEDIIEIELVPASGAPLPAFDAGSHIDVHLAPGLVRQYSLLNSPVESHRYCVGVLKDPASRGGSVAVHRDFQVGKLVTISEPRNNFKLEPDAADTVLVAGGIGITPLLSMAHALNGEGKKFSLHYCARSRSRAAFMNRIGSSGFASKSSFYFDDEPETPRFCVAQALASRIAGGHLYICGPSGFIAAVKDAAAALGLPGPRIHVEHFGAAVPVEGGAFTVVAQRSGVTVEVQQAQTIAQALASKGIVVPLSCEQGVCGTCVTPVIEGIPEHRDVYQSDEEKAANTTVTVCCSRSLTSRLVLDI